jgi:SAM-dependent methyltransferase
VSAVADLDVLLDRWRADLAAWAIPEHITAAVTESPWVLPRQVFARRAERVTAAPSGPSFERAWAALDPAGSLLDVGSGAGAASLPLLPRTTSLTAVDSDADMLERLSRRAAPAGMSVTTVLGTWPEAAARAGPADLTVCHHVVYNAPDVRPFLEALTASARRLVVAELTARHPLTALNDLWLRFHGLQRPASPTAADLLEILTAMGLQPQHEAWRRPGGRDYASFDELVDVTRRRLCLPPERSAEVGEALAESGIDPEHPVDLGSSGREVVTIWWNGTAAGEPSPTVLDPGAF